MKKVLFAFLLLILLTGCAGIPVREALKENTRIPAGKIEGNQFMGVRYPFKVSAPSHWKVTMEFPDFLEEMGYDRPSPMDREQTELYIFNPETKSSVQFDFTPAGRYSVFSQAGIERLTTVATGSLKEELEKEHGKEVQPEIGPTTPYPLKGVQYAAKKYATYTIKGVKREQGWIYGFNEPYQIFVLYQVIEKGGVDDRQDIKKILDSFEVFSKK
ncbi:MAG: hypothetical protein A2W09_06755 [Deltaproteobacteria bacterium RBG_16_50_11]|nr:MAG: hypothetical protein A2W09_06755 [Deltaproteobacteria bacterium RBG_16_50_11]